MTMENILWGVNDPEGKSMWMGTLAGIAMGIPGMAPTGMTPPVPTSARIARIRSGAVAEAVTTTESASSGGAGIQAEWNFQPLQPPPTPRGSANPATRAASGFGSRIHADRPGLLPEQLRSIFLETEFAFHSVGQDVRVTGGMHPSAYHGSTWPPV